ncbi:MAG: permease, partial [Desulfovibrio sp.]|nr:permease [Desulfovibrio sp.]
KYDYATICGLLAGSMTDPPALAFCVQMLGSDAASSVYATVYPLTMILRILYAQVLVLVLYSLF